MRFFRRTASSGGAGLPFETGGQAHEDFVELQGAPLHHRLLRQAAGPAWPDRVNKSRNSPSSGQEGKTTCPSSP